MASTDATINIRANADSHQIYREVDAKMREAERMMSNRRSSLPTYSKDFNDFQRSIDAAATRVFSFGATAATFLTVKRAIVELVKSTVEVEKAMADVNVVLNLSSTNLVNFRREIFNVAKDTGQTFKTVSTAAIELSRQGLGAAETQKRLRDAMILTRLAGLEAGASVEALTATINSFSNSIIDSTELVSKFARVDAAFAVSSKDFAEAIKRVGSTAEDAGVDINQLIGLVTALQQATGRGGANIGQSLKTLLTRPQRSGIIEELEKVGITVRDSNGNLLQMVEILDRVEDSFKRLGKQDQSRITELLGSLYQINQLRSLLKDLGRDSSSSVYGRATKMAEGSSGNEAILRNLELNKTLSAQINRLAVNTKQSFSDIGDIGLSGNLKNLTGTINEALEGFANRDSTNIGVKIGDGILKGIGNAIVGPLGAGILGLLGKAAYSVLMNLFKAIESYNSINKLLTTQSSLVTNLANASMGRLAIEQDILSIINGQNAARSKGIVVGNPNSIAGQMSGVSRKIKGMDTLLSNPAVRNDSQMSAIINAERKMAQSELNNLRSSYQESRMQQTFNRVFSGGLDIFTERDALETKAQGGFLGFGGRNARGRLSSMASQNIPGAQDALDSAINQRNIRLGRVGWGAMLGGPILGSAYGSSFDTSTRGGRVGRAASEGVGGALGYAGTGFMMGSIIPGGGPVGAAIGGTLGLLSGLVDVFREFNTVLPEVTRGMEEAKDAFARSQERGTKVAQLAEMTSNIREGTMKPTPGNISNWMKMFRGTTMGSGMSKEISEAIFSGNPEQIAAVQESISRGPGKAKALQDLGGLFHGLIGSDSSTVGYVTSAFSELAGDISDTDRSALGGIFSSRMLEDRFGNRELQSSINWNPIINLLAKKGMNSPLLLASLKALSSQDPAKFKLFIKDLATKPDINTNAIEKRLRGLAPKGGKSPTEINALVLARSLSEGSIMGGITENNLSGMLSTQSNELETFKTSNQMILGGMALTSSPSAIEAKRGFLGREEAIKSGSLAVSGIRGSTGTGIMNLAASIKNLSKDFGPDFGELLKGAEVLERAGGRLAMGDQNAGKDIYDTIGNMSNAVGNNATRKAQLGPILDQMFILLQKGLSQEAEKNEQTESLTRSLGESTKHNEFMVSATAKAMEAVNSYKTSLDELIERNRRMSASGTLFSDEIASGNLEGRFAGIRRGSLGSKDMTAAMGASFSDQLAFGVKDLYRDLIQGAADVGTALKMSFKDAFRTFLDGSESAGAALRNLGLSFANKLLDIAATGTTNMLFGGLQSLGAAAFAPKFGPGFAAGGYVGGGSGIRDDVPAMLSEGDFVLRKSAVSKYGVGRLSALNFAGGGGVNFTPSSPLSNFALSDENNPQNQLRMEKEASDLNALLQYNSAKSAFDAAKRQRRLGALINLGVGLGAAGISYGASKLSWGNASARGPILDAPRGFGSQNMGLAASGGLMTHLGVQRFASGGSVDNVPALLTGGEFVMNRSAVARHGVGFMHRLNRGEVPGFNNGGFVGETIEGGGTGRSEVNFGDSISRLINSNEKLRSVMEKGGTTQEGGNQSVSQLVGSISINVHVDSSGNAKADIQTEGSNTNSNNNQAERGAQIADLIKSTVLETINKETRNGGILEQNFQRRR